MPFWSLEMVPRYRFFRVGILTHFKDVLLEFAKMTFWDLQMHLRYRFLRLEILTHFKMTFWKLQIWHISKCHFGVCKCILGTDFCVGNFDTFQNVNLEITNLAHFESVILEFVKIFRVGNFKSLFKDDRFFNQR